MVKVKVIIFTLVILLFLTSCSFEDGSLNTPEDTVRSAVQANANGEREQFNDLVIEGREWLWNEIENCNGRSVSEFEYETSEINLFGQIQTIVQIYDGRRENGGFVVKSVGENWYLDDSLGKVNCELDAVNSQNQIETDLLESEPQVDDISASSMRGSIIAFGYREGSTGHTDLYLMNTENNDLLRLTDGFRNINALSWAPNGSQIAFRSSNDIWIIGSDGNNLANITNSPQAEGYPSWSPDGSKVAFTRDKDIWVTDADGTNQSNLTSNIDTSFFFVDWSSANNLMLLIGEKEFIQSIHIFDPNTRTLTDLSFPGFEEMRITPQNPQWSPNGKEITFNEDFDIWIANADGSNLTNLTNTPNDKELDPIWSPDGTKLLFYYSTFPYTLNILTISSKPD